MRMPNRKTFPALAVLVGLTLCIPAAVRADGDSRPATEAEKSFYHKVMTALEKACPPGPEGWEETDRTGIDNLEYVGAGSENTPFKVDFTAAWVDAARRAASEEKQVAAGVQVMQAHPTDQTEQALQDDLEKIAAAIGAAAEKGDAAEMQRLQVQAEKVVARMNEINSKRNEALNQAVRAAEAHDVQVEIRMIANVFNEEFYGPFSEQPAFQGFKRVRTEGEQSEHYGWREGTTYIFMGDWKLVREDGGTPYFKALAKPGVPPTKVQTILARVKADPARAEAMIERLDWEALKALMK
ncbi:MAG: hypothetical protein V1816_16290 [Pseudomonadota bacterium]